MSWLRKLAQSTLITLVGCLVIFVLVEGVSSTVLLAWDSTKLVAQLGSARHVRFDDELGWSNAANTSILDRYGPGRSVHINSQGLRAQQTFTASVPAERIRILCSGDSFTFGKGADDSTTWCERLGAKRADIQPVNAGEEAYGLGQIYLKTKKLSASMKWNVNVFAFIADDIRRMGTLDFIGRQKPRLVLSEGKLQIQNVPVPKASQLTLWMRANGRVFRNLRFLEFAGRIGRKLGGPGSRMQGPRSDDERAAVAGAILKAAQQLSERQGAQFVAVFLPSGAPLAADDAVWRPLIAEQCAKLGIPFFDAVGPPLAQHSITERQEFYDPVYRHYSPAGDQLIADLIWAHLNQNQPLAPSEPAQPVAPAP